MGLLQSRAGKRRLPSSVRQSHPQAARAFRGLGVAASAGPALGPVALRRPLKRRLRRASFSPERALCPLVRAAHFQARCRNKPAAAEPARLRFLPATAYVA